MGLRWPLLLLGALSVACDRSSEQETAATGGFAGTDGGSVGGAGAGGSGGTSNDGGATGGTTQVGGSGGSAEIACKQKDSAPPPAVGFAQWPAPAGAAVVSAVSPGQLKLDLASDAGALIFAWAGPDLADAFVPGEAVEVGYANEWEFVAGSTHVAAAWRQGGFSPPSFIFVPHGGPELSAAYECFYSTLGGCSHSPVSVLLFALVASKDGVTVKVPMTTTQTVAGWAITNVRHYLYPLDQHEGCVEDADFDGIVTALGPVSDASP